MAIPYQPKVGEVLMCDFDGSVPPEMVKVRPVVVIARNRSNGKLVTVVPLSTTAPLVSEKHHHHFKNPLPDAKEAQCWAKCDMLATVSTTRLAKYKTRHRMSGREHHSIYLPQADLLAVRTCVIEALNLHQLIGAPKVAEVTVPAAKQAA